MTKLISSIKKPLALLAAVLLLACIPAAAYAVPAVDTAAQCALTVRCAYASAPLEGVSVRVYRAADVDANMRFTLAPAFADSGVDLAAMTGAAQWSSAAAALAKYAQETKLTPEYSGKTDASGALALSALTPGLYLVGETRLVAGRQQYIGGAFLVALPGITDAGVWFYDVTAIEKVEEKPYKPPTPPDTKKPGETTEPTGTTASGATGTTAPEETTIPGEVTGTTEPEETTTPGGSTEPGETTEPGTTTAPGGDLPQTGQRKWPVPVMFALGVLLSTIGILLRRRDDDA